MATSVPHPRRQTLYFCLNIVLALAQILASSSPVSFPSLESTLSSHFSIIGLARRRGTLGCCCEKCDIEKGKFPNTSILVSSTVVVLACLRGGAANDDFQLRNYNSRADRFPHTDDTEYRGEKRAHEQREENGWKNSQRHPLKYEDENERYDRRGAEARTVRGPRRGPDPRGGGRQRSPEERRARYNHYGRDNDELMHGRHYEGSTQKFDDQISPQRHTKNYQPWSDNNGHDGENSLRKSWFQRKIGKELGSKPVTNMRTSETSLRNEFSTLPPPPPPPPPHPSSLDLPDNSINPAETERTPIHYMFPTAEIAAEERRQVDIMSPDETTAGKNDENSLKSETFNVRDVPFLEVRNEPADESLETKRRKSLDSNGTKKVEREYASPRRDAVTMYMSTTAGALKVRFGSMIFGALLGAFTGKSLMNDAFPLAFTFSSILLISGFFRNDYGELSRTVGLALLFTLDRTRSIRRDYPTLPHLKALIRQRPRKPFPPVAEGENPWQYQPVYDDDPDFRMAYVLLSMAFVGSFCGGNVPLLPAWLGGILGAGAFAFLTLGANAQGDLARSMGMRVVGLIQIVLSINSELKVLAKSATVGGLVFDKIMIMDRKHKIKDKIVAICKWGYDKVSRTASQIQADIQEGGN